MIKELRKDNKKIFEVQISSQSEAQQQYFTKDISQISTKKQEKKMTFNLHLQTIREGAKTKQSQAQISVRTGKISKLTFMDQQSDSSSPQVDDSMVNNCQITAMQDKKNRKFFEQDYKNTNTTEKLQTLIVKQNRQQSYMVLQKKHSDQKQSPTKILQKLNLGRGLGKMQSSRMINKFSTNDEIQIDYDQFQTKICSLKKINQTNQGQIKPKQFFSVQSIQKNIKKNQVQFINQMNIQRKYGSPNTNYIEDNYQEYTENRYQEYVINSDQQQKKSKREQIFNQADCSETQEQQNQKNQHQTKQMQSQEGQVTNQSQQEINNQFVNNLFQPSDEYAKNGEKLGQNVANSLIIGEVLKFIVNPIPPNCIMHFQVIRKRQFLFVDYQFWIVMQDKKIRLMRSASNSINVQSTVIHILLGVNDQIKLNLATMVSNFKRQQFYITSNQVRQQKVLATIATCAKPSITGKPHMELYTPVLSENKHQFKQIHVNKVSNNLRKLKQVKSTKNQIGVISSMPIGLKDWQVMSQKYGIRMSKRNVLMGQSRQNFACFMGKTKKNHYCLTSLSGLSPIQLFSFAIVQLFK